MSPVQPDILSAPQALLDLVEIETQLPTPVMPVMGRPDDRLRVGLVVKRTYDLLDDGTWKVADAEEQRPVSVANVYQSQPDGPIEPRFAFMNELHAFKKRTDVAVFGFAHTYGTPAGRVRVSCAVGPVRRTLDVSGERRVERARDGSLALTTAEPFEQQEITSAWAYGGVDAWSMEQNGLPDALVELMKAIDDPQLAYATPYHYPRNRSGVGYVLSNNPDALLAAEVPRVEFPFDPVTPERMALPGPAAWPLGMMPAAMDWQPLSVFPRCAYAGFDIIPRQFGDADPEEVTRGWADRDLRSVKKPSETGKIHPGTLQCARPGMTAGTIEPGAPIVLEGMHPEFPRYTVPLPDEVPVAVMRLVPDSLIELEPKLSTVELRTEEKRLVMTWCCSAETDREYPVHQVHTAPQGLTWRRMGED